MRQSVGEWLLASTFAEATEDKSVHMTPGQVGGLGDECARRLQPTLSLRLLVMRQSVGEWLRGPGDGGGLGMERVRLGLVEGG
jgi:hypothetical protein